MLLTPIVWSYVSLLGWTYQFSLPYRYKEYESQNPLPLDNFIPGVVRVGLNVWKLYMDADDNGLFNLAKILVINEGLYEGGLLEIMEVGWIVSAFQPHLYI
jgi:hypothetical protein